MLFFSFSKAKKPVLTSLEPSSAKAGDIVTLTGENFGSKKKQDSFVEIAGSKVTLSRYISWTPTQIKIKLPDFVDDGLVNVCVAGKKSNPVFFCDIADLPQQVSQKAQNTNPTIKSLSLEKAKIGQTIKILGLNFGTSKGASCVYFSAPYSENEEGVYFLKAQNTDYEYWGDTEIRVHIPCGTKSGFVYVDTQKAQSNKQMLQIDNDVGQKSFVNHRTYVMQTAADIDNSTTKQNAVLTFHLPRVLECPRQNFVLLSEVTPEPVTKDYYNAVVQEMSLQKGKAQKTRFTQTFKFMCFQENTKIQEKKVPPYTKQTLAIYENYLKNDDVVPFDNVEVAQVAKKITQNITNPYTKAKMIFDFFVQSFHTQNKLDKKPKDAGLIFSSGSADAYDITMLYCALLRRAGVIACPIAGVLVDANLNIAAHWWVEFYIQDFGFVSVDVALSCGLAYKYFSQEQSLQESLQEGEGFLPKDFYFGNIDAHHIAFSKGYVVAHPAQPGNKIVTRVKTYALQSIWEESSINTLKYSSLWNDPVIIGMY